MTPALECVLDASVAVKLHLVEAHSDRASILFDLLTSNAATMFHVPDLFYAECANILWKHCQRGTITEAKARSDIQDLTALRLQAVPAVDLVKDALDLALAHSISAYDGCYAALAQRLQVPLITADVKLEQKMAGSPVTVIWLGNWTAPAATP